MKKLLKDESSWEDAPCTNHIATTTTYVAYILKLAYIVVIYMKQQRVVYLSYSGNRTAYLHVKYSVGVHYSIFSPQYWGTF